MTKTLLSFLLIFYFLFTGIAYAQDAPDPVRWSYSYTPVNDNEGTVIIKAVLDEDWHIYSQHQSADAGPIPTSFVFMANSDFEPIGKPSEPQAEKVYSEVFGADVISFSKEVLFQQKIKRINAGAFELHSQLEFMACNNNMCLPPITVKFSVHIPAK